VATFTAGSAPGGGLLEGEFRYDYPFGHGPIYAWGEVLVTIDPSPIELWEVNATFSETVTRMADTSWVWDIEGGYRFRYDNRYNASSSGQAHLHGLIRNESGNGEFVYSMNEDPVVMTASGNLSEHQNEKLMEFMSGEIPIFGGFLSGELASGSRVRTDWLNVSFDEGGFYFEYSPTYQYVSLHAGGEGNANYRIKTWEGDHWETSSGSDFPDCSLDVGWSQEESGGAIQYSDSVYTFSFSGTVTDRRSSADFGMLTEITRQSLNGSIRPSSRMETGIEADCVHFSDPLPCKFQLATFPNPFNSTARIQFHTRMDSHVRLMITDLLGRRIDTLVDAFYPTGSYQLVWKPTDLSSGLYVVYLRAGSRVTTNKLIYMR
jgi:hypothetical protein